MDPEGEEQSGVRVKSSDLFRTQTVGSSLLVPEFSFRDAARVLVEELLRMHCLWGHAVLVFFVDRRSVATQVVPPIRMAQTRARTK